MDDCFLMRGLQAVGGLAGQIESVFERQGASFDSGWQALALDELQREKSPSFGLVDFMDGTDVGMI